jgi:hypothetical protein
VAVDSTVVADEESGGDQLVAILLAMAMFVLVVDPTRWRRGSRSRRFR